MPTFIQYITKKIENEESRKALIIFIFGTTGTIISLYFAIDGIIQNRPIFYIATLSSQFFAGLGSIIYYIITRKYKTSAYILIISFLILCILLFSFLGVKYAGVLWFFVFSPLATLMTNYKIGLFFNFIIYVLVIFLIINPFDWNVKAYSFDFMIRFLIAFPVASSFILLSEFTRAKTLKAYYNSLDTLKNNNLELTAAREELKHNLQRVKESESALKESNKTKDKLFSIIAHDLRNPFNSVLGLSDFLIEEHKEMDPEMIEKNLEVINNSAKKIFDLLDNLLTWSRFQLGQMSFEPTKISLNSIITDVLNLLKESAENKSIIINIETNHDLSVQADKIMMTIVLQNLVSNAIKFTPSGGTIALTTVVLNENQSVKFACIKIQDNGVGISPDRLEVIFDVTTNKSTTGTENETGTGLGLILCKEFIDKHNGEINAESEIGKGSIFRIKIPLSQ